MGIWKQEETAVLFSEMLRDDDFKVTREVVMRY